MKKITILFFLLAFSTMFSSCLKEGCYSCTYTVLNITTKEVICDGKVTTSVGGIKGTPTDLPAGYTEEEYATELENSGYTCKGK